MKLCEHSKHELSQRNISPEQDGIPKNKAQQHENKNAAPKKLRQTKYSEKRDERKKEHHTKIGQSAHGDSEQLQVEWGKQGWMHRVGRKWEIFH